MDILENYIKWYKENRSAVHSNIYLDKSTLFKRITIPYSDWSSMKVIDEEVEFNRRSIDQLKSRIETSADGHNFIEHIDDILLSLKNRAEYSSSQSDVHVVFLALIAFMFAYLSSGLSILAKLGLGVLLCCVFVYIANQRISTRRETAICKEIVNIVEIVKRELNISS